MDHTDPHPNTTANAQEWAKAINAGDTYLPQEWTEAAADLITDLTENWVSIKAMQEWRRKHRGSISDNALKDLADLLPAHSTMADIEWDDDEHHLAGATVSWAEGTTSEVVMLHRNGNTIAVHQSAPNYTGLRELNPAILTPTGRKYRLEPAESVPKGVPIETEFDPAYTYRDKDGAHWSHINHNWRCTNYGKEGKNYLTPPAEYGPYTRIEDTK